MIKCEKEVIKYLNLPSIPKKDWDGESSFKNFKDVKAEVEEVMKDSIESRESCQIYNERARLIRNNRRKMSNFAA